MLHPTIEELTKGKFNRYQLAIATAKCARKITDEYVRQHDAAEKAQLANKDGDRSVTVTVDRELRDEKAVQVAVNRMYAGEYVIDEHAGEEEEAEKAAAAEMADLTPEGGFFGGLDLDGEEEDDEEFDEDEENGSESFDEE